MLSRRILRTKVVKAVYAHTQCEGITPVASEKNLVNSINKAYDLYFHLLALVPEIAEYAAERIRIGENKKLPTYDDLHPNRKFVENKVIARLNEDEELQAQLKARKLSWANHRDLIVALYNALVRQPFYMKYMASDERSFREDAQLVSDIYMTMLEEFEPLDRVLEEQSILWNDDLGFLLTMVSRTILSMRESHESIKLMPQFKSDEDLDYAKSLLRNSIASYERISLMLDNAMNNWDIERVALMESRTAEPIQTDCIFPTILGLGGVSTPYGQDSLALTSPKYVTKEKRTYLSDHNEPLTFDRCLEKQDIQAMEQRGMRTY